MGRDSVATSRGGGNNLCAGGHGLEGLAEQDLLKAQRAALVHREVHPVDENPVVGLSFGHALAVSAAQHIVHQRHHAGPHLTHKILVARVLVIVGNRLEPVERVVHDGVDVGGDGVFAAQLADGALHAFRVEVQVVVHQVRLDGVARPRPAVALDAVHKKFAGGQVHRIGADLPDTVQLVIVATERTRTAFIEGSVFVVHQHIVVSSAGVALHIDEAESLGRRDGGDRGGGSEGAGAVGGRHPYCGSRFCRDCRQRRHCEHIQCFAMLLVEGFLSALAIINADGALQALHLQVAEGFAAEVK